MDTNSNTSDAAFSASASGGFDPGGSLKVAAQTYGTASGNTDFWPGPLTDFGTVGADTCLQWDRFFKVTGESIRQHLRNWEAAKAQGIPYDPDLIPLDIRAWPARGNPFFFDAIQNIGKRFWLVAQDVCKITESNCAF